MGRRCESRRSSGSNPQPFAPKLFRLATLLYPQNDWAAWQFCVNYEATVQAPSPTLHKKRSLSSVLGAFRKSSNDLFCTTPRLCQKKKKKKKKKKKTLHICSSAGQGDNLRLLLFSSYRYALFKFKVLCWCQRGSTETTRLQFGSSVFGDTPPYAWSFMFYYTHNIEVKLE